MATVPKTIVYPDSDGKPVAETPIHRDNLLWQIEILRTWFMGEEMVYVSGNMFLYYVPGNTGRRVAPDVFVVRGVPKKRTPERRSYLVWEEGKGPDLITEVSSRKTRKQDLETKFRLYQDVLRVREYFLFDPLAEYLKPPLKGYRLRRGKYERIRPVHGRLPSEVLGLHLERDDWLLRLYDPSTQQWLPTPPEQHAAWLQAEAARDQAEAARDQAEAARDQAETESNLEKMARQRAEAEIERLRRELDALRGHSPPQS